MTRVTRWLMLIPVAAGGLATPATADSIWDRRDPRYAFLFQDVRARNVGDILTVAVTESTTANETENRNLDKRNNLTASANFTGATSATGSPDRAAGANFSYTDNFRRQFAGSAQMTANRQFTDRMAVTVVDVMPNGNLVIEGYRSRVVAGEERVLRMTGVVRPADIGLGNVVPSTAIANFRVSYLGRGPASRAVNQNYGGRLLNLVWPW